MKATLARTVIRCKGCGRIIGEKRKGEVVIKHKGRIVTCYAPCKVTCDNPQCRVENLIEADVTIPEPKFPFSFFEANL